MLYLVFTVDGDWEEYYNPKLSEEARYPDLSRMLGFIEREIKLAKKYLSGKFVHFIHTSPRARNFFLRPEFIKQWKQIEKNGGAVGVHCHEDDPDHAYYYNDAEKMRYAINPFVRGLKEAGLSPAAYRGGYLAFGRKIIPILEANKIQLDFSCEPGRHLFHGKNLVSDWRGAPENYYRMGYKDYKKPGKSKVFEIPIGKSGEDLLYVEKSSLLKFQRVASRLKEESKDKDIIVSMLSHSYEFGSPLKLLKIKLALLILKRYAKFICIKEALEKIGEESE